MKILLTLLIFVSFSYAGLSDFLKQITEREDCGSETFRKCDDTYYSYLTMEIQKCRKYERDVDYKQMEQIFPKCVAFVKECKCWAKTKWVTPQGNPEDPKELYIRAERFKKIEEAISWFPQAKQAHLDFLAKREEEEAAKIQAERQEKARQDSIRQEYASEIYALIGNDAETSLILDKCKEYQKAYYNGLPACTSIRDSVNKQQEITEITALLKANKLEECLDGCKRAKFSSDEKIMDMCEKQLISKIRKLPLKKINSVSLAEIYYENQDITEVVGYVFQNDGKMLLINDLVWGNTIMVQYAAGYIGDCRLRQNRQIPFGGYAKYLGDKVYTTVLGVRQSVPNYQLLWCR